MKDNKNLDMITLIDKFIEVLEYLRDEEKPYYDHRFFRHEQRFYINEQITKLILMKQDIRKWKYNERA